MELVAICDPVSLHDIAILVRFRVSINVILSLLAVLPSSAYSILFLFLPFYSIPSSAYSIPFYFICSFLSLVDLLLLLE